MTEWIYYSLILLTIVGGGGFLGWLFVTIIDVSVEVWQVNKGLKLFRTDFEDSLKHSQPDWAEMKEIASLRGLTQSQIQFTLKEYIREIRAGRKSELKEHIDLIKTYINNYKNDEPFEKLPSNLRIHLERLRDQLSNQLVLEPLTVHIKELVSINNKENKKLKFYTVGGFFVGLFGIALALFFYVSPNIA